MAIAYTSPSQLKAYMGIATADVVDDAAFTAVATAINALLEDYLGAPIGDGGTAIRTYDGDGSDRLFIRGGVNAITTLEVADQTGGTFTTAGTATYVIRPHTYERPTGWPGWYVQFTDQAATIFTQGYDTVRITPGTAWGFTATPEEIKNIANVAGVKLFQSRKTGETIIGSTDFGQAIISRLFDRDQMDILDHYAYTVGGRRRAT